MGPREPLLVFVEIVATDGAVTVSRQTALLALATAAGFLPSRVVFVSAYRDRAATAFKKTIQDLAWRSFAWFVSEPQHLVAFIDGANSSVRLRDLIDLSQPTNARRSD